MRSPSQRSVNAKERILTVSRNLFNANGVKGTPIAQIAAELDMSPGNLTYHFKTKSDLVRALTDNLERQLWDGLLSLEVPLSAQQIVDHNAKMFDTLWSYRFFFNSGPFLGLMDPELGSLHFQVCERMVAILYYYLEQIAARGDMRRPEGEHGLRLLCENIVAVWLQWLRLESARTPDAEKADRAALRRAMAQHVHVMEVYLTAVNAGALEREADRRLGRLKLPPLPSREEATHSARIAEIVRK